jgi:hypothetical protein
MKRKKQMISAGMLLVFWTVAGCTPTLSTIENNPSSNIVVHGMPYYLPIGKITLKGEFAAESHPAGDTDHAGDSSTTENPPPKKSDGSSANSSPIENPNKSKEKLELAAATPSPKKGPTKTKKDDTTTGDTSSDTNSTAIKAGGWTITLTAEVEADKTAPCYAIPRRNYLFDDEYHVTVNGKHLLTAGNTTAADRTADIVGSVASLVTQAMALRGGVPAPSHESFYLSFHTNDATEFGHVQGELKQRAIFLDLEPQPGRLGSKNVAKESYRQANTADGLAFRLATPYQITLKSCTSTSLQDCGHSIYYTQQFLLPTPDQTYVFDYARMPFAKKILEIGFTNGMLTDYHETLPSPVLGFLGIPKSILAAIIPVPNGVNTGGTGTRASTSGGNN